MANNRMKNVWLEKQKAEDRLNKVRSKKANKAGKEEEKPHVESSIDNSSESGTDNS